MPEKHDFEQDVYRKSQQKRAQSRHERRQRQRRKQILIFAIEGAVVALLVIVLLFLLFKGEESGKEPVSSDGTAVQQEEEQDLVSEQAEEEAQQQEETEQPIEEPVSTVKTVATETQETTVGIDVSEYQGNIDWDKAAEGLDFAIVRVGYRKSDTGEITEDRCARYNLQEARDRGLHLGAYFFSTAVSEEEAVEEARWVCELLAGYPITYPVAYNCEGFQDPDSRQYELTIEERSAIAQAFLDEVEAQGYTGMFYAARNELAENQLWNTTALELKYRVWVAQYGGGSYPETEKPQYSGKYVMWQYTNQGTVDGIDGAVDKNVSYIGYSAAAKPKEEGTASAVEADPEVGVSFTEVQEQVTAKDTANLRSSMDQSGDGNLVAQLVNGDTALRTGKGNNGWSRVEYNGETLYVVSSLLTTDLSYKTPAKEPESEFKTKFTTVSERVTAKEVTNLRNRPSVEAPSEVIVQLYNGETIIRTGVSDVGWSRVEYNGQTLYCISSLLQTVE